MKIDNRRLFTHPVLAADRDDYKTCHFNAERKFSLDAAGNLVFDMNFSTNCTEINQLIREDRAKYLLHVECPSTLYRKIFTSIQTNFSCEIPLNRVREKIFCVAFIVLSEEIKNFSCANWNADFDGIRFDLPKGTVLAYENLLPLDINEDPNIFKNVASIFTVSKRAGDKSKPFEVNLGGEKVNIILNETDYNLYRQFCSDRKMQPILNTMIILPALVYIFNEFQSDDDKFSTYGERKWFLALKTAYKRRKINFEEYILEKTSIELAQEVMHSPLTKALENIRFIYEDATNTEDDD